MSGNDNYGYGYGQDNYGYGYSYQQQNAPLTQGINGQQFYNSFGTPQQQQSQQPQPQQPHQHQHQNQNQNQYHQQPSFNEFLNNPAAQIGVQFGAQALSAGQKYVNSNVSERN